MAFNINQSASVLTMVNSHLVYAVTSSNGGKPQYQFICQLQDSGSNLLTTIKQRPNPDGYGVFDLGRIARQFVSYDTYTPVPTVGLLNTLFYKQTDTAKTFKIRFGEEYGTTATSPLITASITSSADNLNYWIGGYIDNNYGSYDWDYTNYYKPEVTPSSATFNYNVGLTKSPRTIQCQPEDMLTVSFINGALDGSPSEAQDIYQMSINVYNGTTNIYNNAFYNIGGLNINQGGPRSDAAQLWSSVTQPLDNGFKVDEQNEKTFVIHAGIGPQNLSSQITFDFVNTTWTHYEIEFYPQQAANTPNTNGVWDSFRIENQNVCCGYETVRFMWVNDFGVWDYYNFLLKTDNSFKMERNTFEKTFVDYSVSSPTYDIKRRGVTAFDTKINQLTTAHSDWLTQEQAEYIEPMFYSPSVYIQSGSVIVPVVLETNELITKTNIKTQKMFEYAVSYYPASQKRSR